jgi:hypothetical protein
MMALLQSSKLFNRMTPYVARHTFSIMLHWLGALKSFIRVALVIQTSI